MFLICPGGLFTSPSKIRELVGKSVLQNSKNLFSKISKSSDVNTDVISSNLL